MTHSNRQEQLLASLVEAILSSRALSNRHLLFLPSEALRGYYQQHLAELLYSTLDVELCLPSQAPEISRGLGLVDLGKESDRRLHRSPLDQQSYELALVEKLTSYLHTPLPPLMSSSPLLQELSQRGSEAIYSLAKTLARSFAHYGLLATRPLEVQQPWEWQGALYREIHQDLAQRFTYYQLLEHLSQEVKKRVAKGAHFYFISFSHLPPVFLSWVEALSLHHPVHWFFLSPSRLFWADLSSSATIQRQLAQTARQSRPLVSADLELLLLDRHPLLANLAQLARPLAAFLERQESESEERYLLPFALSPKGASQNYQDLWWQDLPVEERKITLLRALQADLLLMRPSYGQEPAELKGETSLLVHSLADPDLEVRLLRAVILRLLHDDPSLVLEDLLILAPDIERYQGVIEHHFEASRESIPYSIYDSSLGGVEALISLLHFALGPWTYAEYRQLLERAEISNRWEGSRLLHELEAALELETVHWGVDELHRDQIAPDLGLDLQASLEGRSWRLFWQGQLKRWLHDPCCSPPAGLAFHQKLVEHLQPWYRRQEKSLREWVERVRVLLDELLELQPSALESLEGLLDALSKGSSSQPLSCKTFTELLLSRLQGLQSPWRGERSGVLRFASMQPMRSLPVKHLLILGLSDSLTSRWRPRPAFEWGMERGIASAPTQAQLDRHSFLEAILSARDSLHLFYSRCDPKSALSESEPSSLLTELIGYLDHSFSIEGLPFSQRLCLEHPSSWLDPIYQLWPYHAVVAFDPPPSSQALASPFSPEESGSAPSLSAPLVPAPLVPAPLEVPEALSCQEATSERSLLQVHQLTSLLTDPLRFHLIACLRSVRGWTGHALPREFEIVASYRQREQWDELISSRALEGVTPEEQAPQGVALDPLLLQASPSRLAAHAWRAQHLEAKKQREYHLKEVQRGGQRQGFLSPGYGVLGLPDLLTSGHLVGSPLTVQGPSRRWTLLGGLGEIDTSYPHAFLPKAGKKARVALAKEAIVYLLAYKKGWLKSSLLTLYCQSYEARSWRLDLEALDRSGYIGKLLCAAEYLQREPVLFHPDLYPLLEEGSARRYALALKELLDGCQGTIAGRLGLWLEAEGFDPHSLAGEKKAQKWLEGARSYLKPLWEPLLAAYDSKSHRSEEELDYEL